MLSVIPLQIIALLAGEPAAPMASAIAVGAAITEASTDPSLARSGQVDVTMYDVNHRVEATFRIGVDGRVDQATEDELRHFLRCRRSEREKDPMPGLLALIADVGRQYPGRTIEVVSGYRGHAKESKTSPHRASRALDFRVRGVSSIKVRDYLWKNHRQIGVGWYPDRDFVHMDPRPDDLAWTFDRGKNVYHPAWAERVRGEPVKRERPRSRVGV